MSVEDADKLRAVLSGTALKMPTEEVTCWRSQVTFPNSGGVLANPGGIYCDVGIICDVEIYLAGEKAIAVATMPGGGRAVLGRVTVGLGKASEIRPAVNSLLSGLVAFADFFEPVVYLHISRN